MLVDARTIRGRLLHGPARARLRAAVGGGSARRGRRLLRGLLALASALLPLALRRSRHPLALRRCVAAKLSGGETAIKFSSL